MPKMKLVEDVNSEVGKTWSLCVGPPEATCGPTGDCPKCEGVLVYGLECKRHVCISCWSVFKEISNG